MAYLKFLEVFSLCHAHAIMYICVSVGYTVFLWSVLDLPHLYV